MKRRAQWIEFLLFLFLALGMILFINIVSLGILHLHDQGGWNLMDDIYSEFSMDSQYSLSERGKKIIDSLGGFALFIDETGETIWEYNKPEDVPEYFSLMEVASFSRWYLEGYPVFIRITDGGILVIGQPKGTVWKYSLKYDMGVVYRLMRGIPLIIVGDILILIFVPVILTRRIGKRKERERTEWIAGISHDIRTPLSLVLGNAVRIKENTENEQLQRDSAMIEKQALRMKQLVTNLNTENKLTYGAGKWKNDKVCLAYCIREIICDRMNQDEEGLYDFICEIAEELERYEVAADEGLVKRLLENLINNAITHNPQGCEIQISLMHDQKARVRLEIMDNGTGIAEEKLKQLNNKVGRETLPEHGLGLRVVKQIAGHYHWQVTFFGSQGKEFGCRIVFGKEYSIRQK